MMFRYLMESMGLLKVSISAETGERGKLSTRKTHFHFTINIQIRLADNFGALHTWKQTDYHTTLSRLVQQPIKLNGFEVVIQSAFQLHLVLTKIAVAQRERVYDNIGTE